MVDHDGLVNEMETRVKRLVIHGLALGNHFARRQGVGVACRDGFEPFVGCVNHGNLDGTDNIVAAAVLCQEPQPIAVVAHLHRHRRIDVGVGSVLGRRHLPLCNAVVRVLVVPCHVGLRQVERLTLTYLHCLKLHISHRHVIDMEGDDIAKRFVARIDDREAEIICAISQVARRWVEGRERPAG